MADAWAGRTPETAKEGPGRNIGVSHEGILVRAAGISFSGGDGLHSFN